MPNKTESQNPDSLKLKCCNITVVFVLMITMKITGLSITDSIRLTEKG